MAAPSSFRVLVAEDNPADVSLVRLARSDQKIDCTLKVMTDGELAVEEIERIERDLRTHGLDLLLLDMHLPKCEGEQILRHLRSTDRCARTRGVVMTASEAPSDERLTAKQAGSCCFRKPSTFSEFIELGHIIHGILVARTVAAEAG